jgi:predicted RNA-binding Zn ribbon-like protein
MAADGIEDLPLAGGHVALDLVNTVEPRFQASDQLERLDSPSTLLAWARRASLLDEATAAHVTAAWRKSPAAGAQDLTASIELREQLYAALTALLESRPADLASITSRYASAAARATWHQTPEGMRLEAAASIPDRLAFAAVDLVSGLDLNRLRACPPDEGGCGWLFLDHSRNNTRRWCVMADCGTQAKSRKLTARRRSARAVARETTA